MTFHWCVYLIWTLFSHSTTGYGVSLEAYPVDVVVGQTGHLNLSCSFHDKLNNGSDLDAKATDDSSNNSNSNVVLHSSIRKIDSIVIHKMDTVKQIVATVNTFTPATATVNLNKTKTSGYINGSSSPQAFLRVSWNSPSEDQGGNYTCTVYASDFLGRPLQFEQQTEIVTREPTNKEIVARAQKVESHVSQQTKRLKQLRRIQKDVTEWKKKLSLQIMATDSTIAKIFKKFGEIQVQMIHLGNKVDDQREKILQEIGARRQVGFIARGATHNNYDMYSKTNDFTVKFGDIVTNIGRCYDKSTGKFTASADGTHLATMSIRSEYGPRNGVEVSIVHTHSYKEHIVCAVFISSSETSSSCTGVVDMNQGDTLHVESASTIDISKMSSFSVASLGLQNTV